MPVFFDTNILLYAVSPLAHEAAKREQALQLLDRQDGTLSVQVLQEFYVQATRASRSSRITHDQAQGLVEAWTRFKVQDNTLAVLLSALEIKARYGFSYWDSAVIAAARAAGCTELFTEDLSHGQVVEGVRITNPFH
ncbi:twitching motility protein PilT [Caulobacter sp. D4A]|uniref:PIN domain-containing protein n=1 Tax=unclassified Caulobacter TaxID=2648921 RepID=UPI000D726679|nr:MULTISPECIES: PIN domain-containing protein [unclassified Caulobacter]PXA75033.1 twitching motility protein PilT [Caulobacter sp. D4A]PXA93398.1 twitching motility protein PilT [Caulobacter sp. D5]